MILASWKTQAENANRTITRGRKSAGGDKICVGRKWRLRGAVREQLRDQLGQKWRKWDRAPKFSRQHRVARNLFKYSTLSYEGTTISRGGETRRKTVGHDRPRLRESVISAINITYNTSRARKRESTSLIFEASTTGSRVDSRPRRGSKKRDSHRWTLSPPFSRAR